MSRMGRTMAGRGALATALALLAPTPLAAQVPAGTVIANVATVRAGQEAPVASNAATLIVAERLDCTLSAGPATAGTAVVVLTNTGNGYEAYVVEARGADGAPRAVAIDVAGDGGIDAAPMPAGGVTPTLAAAGTLRLLVPLDTGAVVVTAHALTASGAPGTVVAGAGDGGGDAVVGATGALARLTVAPADAPPTIVASQTVLSSDGGSAARRGASVTYSFVCRFASASAAARVVAPVPAGTAYRPGTLVLDGEAIADAGRVGDGGVTVALGAVAAGAVRRLSFQVVIQ